MTGLRRMWVPVLAAACFVGAVVLTPPTAQSLARWATLTVRPLVLPNLWIELQEASRTGDLVTGVAVGRELMRYFEDWADGHVHFAAELAFDAGLSAENTAAALAYLDAGIAWLEDAIADADPERASTYAAAQAHFILARCRQDPALSAALQARSGRDPAEIALVAMDRAIEYAPRAGARRPLEERRAVLLVDVVAAAIRAGDEERVLPLLEAAIELCGGIRDPEASKAWVSSLSTFKAVWLLILRGDRPSLDQLRSDPYLEDLVQAVESR